MLGTSCNEGARISKARRTRARVLGVAIALWIGAVGCATRQVPPIPSVTAAPTQLVKPGKFVWVDLVTDDVESAKAFYGALFGWKFAGGESGYTTVLHEGAAIAGIVDVERTAAGPRKSAWIGNLSVVDVDAAVRVAKARGATIETAAKEAPHRGRIALLKDPTGATVLVVRSSTGDPPDGEPAYGRWLWRELWTHDVETAMGFYSALAGYEREVVDFRDQPYYVLKQSEVPRAGVLEAPPQVRPQWLSYVRVENPAELARRAAELGARVVDENESSAILVDPTGAAVGIQAWPDDVDATEGGR